MVESHYVEMKDWGKDHWSTLAYVETRNVDYRGLIDSQHMRGHREGSDKYPTRLRGGVELHGHDDFDCLRDFVRVGLVISPGGGRWVLTDFGWVVAHALRRWKARGGLYADFSWPVPLSEAWPVPLSEADVEEAPF